MLCIKCELTNQAFFIFYCTFKWNATLRKSLTNNLMEKIYWKKIDYNWRVKTVVKSLLVTMELWLLYISIISVLINTPWSAIVYITGHPLKDSLVMLMKTLLLDLNLGRLIEIGRSCCQCQQQLIINKK